MSAHPADAYREGFRAHQCEEPIEANPYRKPSEDWSRWAEGWLEADRHEGDKADALASVGWFG